MPETTSSRGLSLPAIAYSLMAGSKLAGCTNSGWQMPAQRNTTHASWLANATNPDTSFFKYFHSSELQGFATLTAQEINRQLEGIASLRFDAWNNNGTTIGILSTLNVFVKWIRPCVSTIVKLEPSEKDYPAFTANKRNGFDGVFSGDHHDYPIVKMVMHNGDSVYFSRYNTELEDCDVPRVINDLRSSMRLRTEHEYTCVTIPMVDIALTPDMSWVVGMENSAPSGVWTIAQAGQYLRFRMNQHGAVPKDKTQQGALRGMCFENPLEINGPFLCWFERPNAAGIYATFLCAPDSFKDPGSIWN